MAEELKDLNLDLLFEDIQNQEQEERHDDHDKHYFRCYGSLSIHAAMLKDMKRVDFYHRAFMNNSRMFRDKIVLDVGAGLGLLSIFAVRAGAKKVYAVEASKDLIELCRKALKENGVSDKVELLQGKIEALDIKDQIDIIVSEWMGYCLLYETMLPSLIYARDKYQIPNMCPNLASVYICGFSDEYFYQDKLNWTTYSVLGKIESREKKKCTEFCLHSGYNLDFSSFAEYVCKRIIISNCPVESVATTSAIVGHLDLLKISCEDSKRLPKRPFKLRRTNLGEILT